MNFRVLTFLILACLFPSSVFAFWVKQVDTCEVEPISAVSPCSESEDGEENNVCLEAAAFPISTTESLLKMMESWDSDHSEGEVLLKQIAEVAMSVTSVGDVSLPDKTPAPPRSCSASNIADCEFVPATPTLRLISNAVYASVDPTELYDTTSIELRYRVVHEHRYEFSHKDWNPLPLRPPPQA